MYHRYQQRKNAEMNTAQESKAPRPCGQDIGAGGLPIPFLASLFPGMDMGELLALLVLLLLLAEGNEDSGNVILTLAIFLFL